MTYDIRWTKRALRDFTNISERISQDSIETAVRFTAELRNGISMLSAHPYLGRAGILPDTREFVLHHHYLVTYRITKVSVEILQIWHTAKSRK